MLSLVFWLKRCCKHFGTIPEDYKFYCFNGVPKLVLVIIGRGVNLQYCYFDMNFNFVPLMDKGMEIPK